MEKNINIAKRYALFEYFDDISIIYPNYDLIICHA